jgi:2'-5' RNA ligase
MDAVSKLIKPSDIYNNSSGEFGLEDKPHVTVLYGFHNDVDISKIKAMMPPVDDIHIKLSMIDIFETKKFDVVKFTVESETLHKLNKDLTNNFNYTTEFDAYIPHMTIAYVKRGTGKKYKRLIKGYYIRPYQYRFTSPKNEVITWKK